MTQGRRPPVLVRLFCLLMKTTHTPSSHLRHRAFDSDSVPQGTSPMTSGPVPTCLWGQMKPPWVIAQGCLLRPTPAQPSGGVHTPGEMQLGPWGGRHGRPGPQSGRGPGSRERHSYACDLGGGNHCPGPAQPHSSPQSSLSNTQPTCPLPSTPCSHTCTSGTGHLLPHPAGPHCEHGKKVGMTP